MAATNAAKAAAAKKDVIVDSKELVEDVVELAEDTVELVKKQWINLSNPKVLVGTAALAGLVSGSVLTYLIVSKKLSAKYQAMADEQIEDVKNHYAAMDKPSLDALAGRYAEEAVEDFSEEEQKAAEVIADQEGYTPYSKVRANVIVETPKTVDDIVEKAEGLVDEATELANDLVVRNNVFNSSHPDSYFDDEEEAARRLANPLSPYVITKDEFLENDPEYDQISLTYYDGDDVLTDDHDKAINNADSIVGAGNLLRFGHGSGDPIVVYVRNNKLELDYEIIFSEHKFAQHVLGVDDGANLSHSAARRQSRQLRD